MPINHSHKALLAVIDGFIEKHRETNPELVKELTQLRQELIDAQRGSSTLEYAKTALRIATWVKFIYDLF